MTRLFHSNFKFAQQIWHLWPLACAVVATAACQTTAVSESVPDVTAQTTPETAVRFATPGLYKAAQLPFIAHVDDKPMATYLAVNVPFAPLARLRQLIELRYGRSLSHRGEAHITVITPPEYQRLKPYVNIWRIHAMTPDIQSAKFEIICIGASHAELDGSMQSTYFLVINAPEILALRQRIAIAYRQAGGPEPPYVTDYHPHITIGFTRRDLYAGDGAIKNSQACLDEPK